MLRKRRGRGPRVKLNRDAVRALLDDLGMSLAQTEQYVKLTGGHHEWVARL